MNIKRRDALISAFSLLAIILSNAIILPSLGAFVAGYIVRRYSETVANRRIAAGANLANIGGVAIAASYALLGVYGTEASIAAGILMGVGVFTLGLGIGLA